MYTGVQAYTSTHLTHEHLHVHGQLIISNFTHTRGRMSGGNFCAPFKPPNVRTWLSLLNRKMPAPWALPIGFMIQVPPLRLNSSTNMRYSLGTTKVCGKKLYCEASAYLSCRHVCVRVCMCVRVCTWACVCVSKGLREVDEPQCSSSASMEGDGRSYGCAGQGGCSACSLLHMHRLRSRSDADL